MGSHLIKIGGVRVLILAVALLVLATGLGCGSRNVTVSIETGPPLPGKLDRWVGVASKDIIKEELGSPSMSLPAGGGQARWDYEFSEGDEYCWDYSLMFDADGVLRGWERQRCE